MAGVIDYEQSRTFRITPGWAIFFASCLMLPALAQLAMIALIAWSLFGAIGIKAPTLILLISSLSPCFLLACAGFMLSPRGRFRASIGSQIVIARFLGRRRIIRWPDIQRVEFRRARTVTNRERQLAITLFTPARVTLSCLYLTPDDRQSIESAFRAALPPSLISVRTAIHTKTFLPFLTRIHWHHQPAAPPYPPPQT